MPFQNLGDGFYRVGRATRSAITGRYAPHLTEAQIVDRFGSLSSAAIRRIIDAGAETIEERFADGVFE